MTDIDITLTLPEELVARARAAGILNQSQMKKLIETELERRKALTYLRDVSDRLNALEEKPEFDEIVRNHDTH